MLVFRGVYLYYIFCVFFRVCCEACKRSCFIPHKKTQSNWNTQMISEITLQCLIQGLDETRCWHISKKTSRLGSTRRIEDIYSLYIAWTVFVEGKENFSKIVSNRILAYLNLYVIYHRYRLFKYKLYQSHGSNVGSSCRVVGQKSHVGTLEALDAEIPPGIGDKAKFSSRRW